MKTSSASEVRASARQRQTVRNYLKELLLALADAGVEAVVGGGVACVLQGVERMTLDLLLAIAFDRANLLRFLSVMQAQGLTPRAPVPPRCSSIRTRCG